MSSVPRYFSSPIACGRRTPCCLRDARHHPLRELGELDELLAERALRYAAEAVHALRKVGLKSDAPLLAVIGAVDPGFGLLRQHVGNARIGKLVEPGAVDRLALLLVEQHGAQRLAAWNAAGVRRQNAIGAVLHLEPSSPCVLGTSLTRMGSANNCRNLLCSDACGELDPAPVTSKISPPHAVQCAAPLDCMHGTPARSMSSVCHENFAERALAPLVPHVDETQRGDSYADDRAWVFSVAFAVPAQAAQKTKASDDGASLEQRCRDMVGKEQSEGEGRGGVGRLQAQRFGECLMGTPSNFRECPSAVRRGGFPQAQLAVSRACRDDEVSEIGIYTSRTPGTAHWAACRASGLQGAVTSHTSGPADRACGLSQEPHARFRINGLVSTQRRGTGTCSVVS